MSTPVMLTKGSDSGGSSPSTPNAAAIDVPANSVLFCTGYISDTDMTAPSVGVTSPNLSWSIITETREDSEGDFRERRAFIAYAVVSTALENEALSISHPDTSVTVCAWKVFYVPNATGVRVSALPANDSFEGPASITIDAFLSSSNIIIAELVTNANTTPESGLTLLDIQSLGEVFYKTNDNALTWTFGDNDNDWVALAVEVLIQTNQTATPGKVDLTTSRFAPTVSFGTPVTPNVIALSTSLLTPSVHTGSIITPGVLAVVTQGFSPPLGSGIVVPVLTVITTGFAPDAGTPGVYVPVRVDLVTNLLLPTVSAPRLETPGLATLVTQTFAPQFAVPIIARPDSLEVIIELFRPRVRRTASGLIIPTARARGVVEL